MKLLAWMSVWGLGGAVFGFSAQVAVAAGPASTASVTANSEKTTQLELVREKARENYYENSITSDSGIRGPVYAKIVEELDAVAQAHPTWVDRFQYGKTLKGRPLVALRVLNKAKKISTTTQRQAILIAGSIHGNEYLNIEDRLPRWIIEEGMKKPAIKKFFDDGGVALFAPILNPDGYDARERENKHGVDLNRDFTVRKKGYFAFKEPETKSLSEFVADQVKENNLRLALTMDYHCCIGALLHPWSFKAPKPPQRDMERFAEVGSILKEAFGKEYKFGTTPNILGYQAVGTSKDYYYEAYGSVALTFEGKKNQENKKFPAHVSMWEKLIASINDGKI